MNRVKLPEICTIPITDGTHQTPTYTTKEDGIPFISSKDVTTRKINWTNIKYITKDLHEQLYKRIAPQKNDILLAKNGTTGVAALVEDNRVFDIYVTLAVIRPDLEKVFPKYLLHVINSDYCKKQFSSHLVGIGVPNLHLKDINQTSIPLPPLPEQQKIAAQLDSIQSAIDNKKQQLQQLDELVKSKFVEMFGENPVESGKWKVETLGDVCSSIVRGPFGSALKKEFFVPKSNDTVKVYEQKHAIQKSADIGTYYVTQEKYEELKRFECKPGDFLMSCSGTMGEFYQLPEGCEKGIINQALCKFTLNEKMEPLFFYEWMKHSIHNLETRGSGIKNVAAVSFVKQMPMILPSKEIQNEYVSYVQKIDSAKSIIKTQLVDFQELLDSKMDEYFGE